LSLTVDEPRTCEALPSDREAWVEEGRSMLVVSKESP
jgi:hypothetical protein